MEQEFIWDSVNNYLYSFWLQIITLSFILWKSRWWVVWAISESSHLFPILYLGIISGAIHGILYTVSGIEPMLPLLCNISLKDLGFSLSFWFIFFHLITIYIKILLFTTIIYHALHLSFLIVIVFQFTTNFLVFLISCAGFIEFVRHPYQGGTKIIIKNLSDFDVSPVTMFLLKELADLFDFFLIDFLKFFLHWNKFLWLDFMKIMNGWARDFPLLWLFFLTKWQQV